MQSNHNTSHGVNVQMICYNGQHPPQFHNLHKMSLKIKTALMITFGCELHETTCCRIFMSLSCEVLFFHHIQNPQPETHM